MTKSIMLLLFIRKLESIQYNSKLAITGAISGTSKEKLYWSWALYLCNRDFGIENRVIFTKYLRNNPQITFYPKYAMKRRSSV